MLHKDAKVELIGQAPLFADCSRRELRQIAGISDELDVPADTTLTKEGASGREFILIVEGAAEVHRRGRKVNTLGAGDFLGEIALITGTPRTATVTTTEPTHVLVLTSQAFRSLMRQVPSIQIKVLETLARRIPDEFG
jgi:CRP/FNR family transcriptional regulator, cyclic AMP receptor protein